MTKSGGRPNGKLLHAEAFEAVITARGLLKKDIAADCGISPGFLADLLAHRGGAGEEIVERLASSIGVKVAAIFPEEAGWIGPLPDREAKRPRGVAA